MSDKHQKLVLSILDFLTASMEDGTVKADDREGLEVAVQCIGEAFGVDPSDAAQRERLSIKPATLPSIFEVFNKVSSGRATSGASTTAPVGGSPSTSKSTPNAPSGPTPKDKAAADALKLEGNAHMSARKYNEAIEAYTKAVKLDPANPVYYSNRAAAHSSADDHDAAIDDAEKAAELDPKFVKAYSRLGHAHYAKSDYVSAVEAFERGLEIEPNNANLKANLENAKARLPTIDRTASPGAGAGIGGGGMPDLSALAGMFGGGGGGGGGGMPDLASMMNNPQMMAMAQQMMANGGLENLMSNPAIQNMARNMGSGGGQPNIQDMMNDPEIANLARNFMGGAGGAGGAGRPPPS